MAPISASKPAARIDSLLRPPDFSSPLPSFNSSPRPSARRLLREDAGVHERGAQLRELALVVLRRVLHQEVADGELEDGVAEELELLVVARVARRGERAVRERSVEQVVVAEVVAEPLFDRVSLVGFVSSAAAIQPPPSDLVAAVEDRGLSGGDGAGGLVEPCLDAVGRGMR